MNKDEIITEVLKVIYDAVQDRYTYYEESTEGRALDRLADILRDLVYDRTHPEEEV